MFLVKRFPGQSPLKSCGFAGAEPASYRFSLWKMGFSGCKDGLRPAYTPLVTMKVRKSCGNLALS